MKAGADAAIADVNASGGINGELLALRVGDDQCEARRAAALANEFAASDVRMVAGHFCSGASIAAAKIYDERDVLMISPSASHPRVTDDGFKTTLRIASRDDAQGELAARRIQADDPQAGTVVIDDGTPIAKAIVARFASIKPPMLALSIKPGDKNFSALVQQISTTNATSVYFACGAIEAGNIAAALAADGLALRFYGADGLLADDYWQRAGSAGEGTLVSFVMDPVSSPDAREVVAAFGSRNLPVDGAALPTYAAIQAYAAAAREVPTGKAKDLADWLKRGQSVNTILGELAFDSKGDVKPQRYTWYRWSQGNFLAAGTTN
jgi:branched-chain amino acid transport system substrate-binding protein